MFAYALAIFSGAFLLFQVQPLIGKYILPWFGGGPGVWTTCLLFFQVLLLGGYAYAHVSTRCFKVRVQAIIHGILLVTALALLPITPSDSWKSQLIGNPVFGILLLLSACLGLPYFVLSSTGPLMQQWFSRTHPGVSPYRLYALSNVGSLLALISYPFLVETNLTRMAQARFWSYGFGCFVLCCGFCAVRLWRINPSLELPFESYESNKRKADKPSSSTRILWILLPACASMLLLAITNKLCQDIAVIPFLWVLPLAIYLITFIICFDNPRWYVRGVFAVALVASAIGICGALFLETNLSLRWQVFIYAAGLFVCCMVCHGELYRLRPEPRFLTEFYLLIATGGAFGGLFVAVIAPLVFSDYYELHWGLVFCGLLFTVICAGDKKSSNHQWRWLAIVLMAGVFIGVDALLAWAGHEYPDLLGAQVPLMRGMWWSVLSLLAVLWLALGQYRKFGHWRYLVCFWLLLGCIGLATALWFSAQDFASKVVARSRNFYGTLRVCEYRRDEPEAHHLLLEHGRTTHGLQFQDPGYALWPTTYYGEQSGVALAIKALPNGPRRIGMVGLGAGTISVYGRANDSLRIYEINPEVIRLAESRFTYLSNCPSHVEIVPGDARLSMEKESPQNFDLLALDAFSSDAIPVHLLTQEAFALYLQHLKTNGVIAVHISNRYLNLQPVVQNLAEHLDLHFATIDYEEQEDEEGESQWWNYACTWMILTRDEQLLNQPEIRSAISPAKNNSRAIRLWTDDFASIWQILE